MYLRRDTSIRETVKKQIIANNKFLVKHEDPKVLLVRPGSTMLVVSEGKSQQILST